MPEPAGTKVVLNSYILHEVALALTDESVSAAEESSILEAAPGYRLLGGLREFNHVICVTERLIEEYDHGARRHGLSLILPILPQLEQQGLVQKCRRRNLPAVQVMPATHKVLFEEALRTRSNYLLTRRNEWLELQELCGSAQRLLIRTPEGYISRQRT